jgi:AsmA-like C-terminal region
MEWGSPAAGVSLHPQFLNLPIAQIRARSDFKPGATHTVISSAQAFGALWTGVLDHDLTQGWQFSVSGDSVSAADLDRWLNPRWRESFLDRMLPFLNSRASGTGASDGIRARGRLSLDQFAIPRVVLHHLHGDLNLDGRRLELSNLDAQFYRGEVGGSLAVDLLANPAYKVNVELSGVDLHALSEEFPPLASTFTGLSSAKIAFALRGTTRGDLLDSLECRGTARLNDVTINAISLAQSLRAVAAQPGTSSFHDASAAFTCAAGRIQLQDLRLSGATADWDAAGTITYKRDLDLYLRALPSGSAGPHPAKSSAESNVEYRITGPLDAPQISRLVAATPAATEKP